MKKSPTIRVGTLVALNILFPIMNIFIIPWRLGFERYNFDSTIGIMNVVIHSLSFLFLIICLSNYATYSSISNKLIKQRTAESLITVSVVKELTDLQKAYGDPVDERDPLNEEFEVRKSAVENNKKRLDKIESNLFILCKDTIKSLFTTASLQLIITILLCLKVN